MYINITIPVLVDYLQDFLGGNWHLEVLVLEYKFGRRHIPVAINIKVCPSLEDIRKAGREVRQQTCLKFICLIQYSLLACSKLLDLHSRSPIFLGVQQHVRLGHDEHGQDFVLTQTALLHRIQGINNRVLIELSLWPSATEVSP